MIAEVWDGQRWRLVEPQFGGDYVDPMDGTVIDLLDVSRDKFLVGPLAWSRCRSGEADPARFGVSPQVDLPILRGWPYLTHNLVFDLAALAKHEMILWDSWGVLDSVIEDPPTSRMDELAALLLDPDLTLDAIQRAFADPAVRVPPLITTVNPVDQTPRLVTLR